MLGEVRWEEAEGWSPPSDQSPLLQDFLRQCVEVMVVTTMNNNVKEVSQGLGWESGKAVHRGGPAQVLSFGSWGSVLMCTPVPARWSPTFQAFLQLWDSD